LVFDLSIAHAGTRFEEHAGTRFEEQRQLHLPQKHKATVQTPLFEWR
jgi:hypothetical protein